MPADSPVDFSRCLTSAILKGGSAEKKPSSITSKPSSADLVDQAEVGLLEGGDPDLRVDTELHGGFLDLIRLASLSPAPQRRP